MSSLLVICRFQEVCDFPWYRVCVCVCVHVCVSTGAHTHMQCMHFMQFMKHNLNNDLSKSLSGWIHVWVCCPPETITALLIGYQFSSVQSLSRVWLFVTLWIAAPQASLSITNSRSSLRLTSIELVMLSSHLILCRPLFFLPPIPPSIRVFSNESTLRMRWPKYWSFSFSIILQYKIKTLKKDIILTTVIVCLLLRQMLHHHWTHPDLCSQARKEIKLPFVHVTQC